MKKTANVFYIVSIICSAVGMFLMLLCSILGTIFGPALMKESLKNFSEIDYKTSEIIVIVFIIVWVSCIVLSSLGYLAIIILSVIARKKLNDDTIKKGLSIACIIVGGLASIMFYGLGIFLVVAAILSLIYVIKRDKNAKVEPKKGKDEKIETVEVIDAK